MDKLLLHTCCGPCSIYCVKKLDELEIPFDMYWYNPNIHPYMEYQNRKNTFLELYKNTDRTIHMNDEYGLIEFTREVVNNEDKRCEYCYMTRLAQTAKFASENGYKIFSTTLLVSPYQNHELITQIGIYLGEKYNIEFKYINFSEGYREGQKEAKDKGIYMQKYCGCIYSEYDRYKDKK